MTTVRLTSENVTAALATTSVHVETESVTDRAGEVHAGTYANETSSQQPALVPTWSPTEAPAELPTPTPVMTDAPTALAELGRPPDEDPEAPPR